MAKPSEYGSVRFNLARLRNDNKEGHTQRMFAREVYEGAKAGGPDVQQVRGRRRPTERFDYATGTWVKV